MKGIVSQFMLRLPHMEKPGLLADLKVAIAEGIADSLEGPDSCPRCGSPSFAK